MTREFYDTLPDGTALHLVGMFMKSIQEVTKITAISPEVDASGPSNFVTIHGRNESTETYEDHMIHVMWLHSTWDEAVTHIEITISRRHVNDNPNITAFKDFKYLASARERILASAIRDRIAKSLDLAQVDEP